MTRQRIGKGEGGEGAVNDPDVPFDDDVPETSDPPVHVSGMLMISFGAVQPGREALAIDQFTEFSRFLGHVLAHDQITAFKPAFFADGQLGDVVGFFLVEGHREQLDALRRSREFVEPVLRLGGGFQHVRVQTLVAGTEAGRLVHMFQQANADLGLLD